MIIAPRITIDRWGYGIGYENMRKLFLDFVKDRNKQKLWRHIIK